MEHLKRENMLFEAYLLRKRKKNRKISFNK
jgi:hypothetical protein